jgi:hypothetical protein
MKSVGHLTKGNSCKNVGGTTLTSNMKRRMRTLRSKALKLSSKGFSWKESDNSKNLFNDPLTKN